MFAGLVDGGAQPADPKLVAHMANLLGALAPAPTTSVRVWGYPGQPGQVMDEYAQLWRHAQEAFVPQVPIRLHRCTKLAHSTVDRPVCDLDLEGVHEDWQGVRLGAPDTHHPDQCWERTTRSSRQQRYQPVVSRAPMQRLKGSGEVQQQPENAQDAPDHTGDVLMAKEEPEAFSGDEEDADIL